MISIFLCNSPTASSSSHPGVWFSVFKVSSDLIQLGDLRPVYCENSWLVGENSKKPHLGPPKIGSDTCLWSLPALLFLPSHSRTVSLVSDATAPAYLAVTLSSQLASFCRAVCSCCSPTTTCIVGFKNHVGTHATKWKQSMWVLWVFISHEASYSFKLAPIWRVEQRWKAPFANMCTLLVVWKGTDCWKDIVRLLQS